MNTQASRTLLLCYRFFFPHFAAARKAHGQDALVVSIIPDTVSMLQQFMLGRKLLQVRQCLVGNAFFASTSLRIYFAVITWVASFAIVFVFVPGARIDTCSSGWKHSFLISLEHLSLVFLPPF